MWTIWNRRELISTSDMQRQAQFREALSAHQIEYMVKVVNRKSPFSFAAGRYGENLEMQNTYIFYVYKEDYEQASALIM